MPGSTETPRRGVSTKERYKISGLVFTEGGEGLLKKNRHQPPSGAAGAG